MDDMKDKMKGLMKKVNKPFSSTTPSFRGQGRLLGSGSSSSAPSDSRLLNPRAPPVRPNAKSVPQSKPIPKSAPDPNPTQFSPYDPLISSSSKTSTSIPSSSSSSSPFQCPACPRTFPTESDVSSHLDSCLARQPEPESIEPRKGASHKVEKFLSGNPTENSIEVMQKLLGNIVKEPSSEKFRKIRMGNPKIREAISEVKGGVEVLESLGFTVRDEEGELWATMAVPSEDTINSIKETVELLDRCQRGVSLSFPIRKSVQDDNLKEEPSKSASVESSIPAKPAKIDRQVDSLLPFSQLLVLECNFVLNCII